MGTRFIVLCILVGVHPTDPELTLKVLDRRFETKSIGSHLRAPHNPASNDYKVRGKEILRDD